MRKQGPRNMLQSEFHTLAGIEVSAAEFDAINAVYMLSDVDKIEFCRLWSAMNKTRIRQYKEAQKQAMIDAENRWFVAEIYWYVRGLTPDTMCDPLCNFVSARQAARLAKLGFNIAGPRYSVAYDLGVFAGCID